MDIYQKEIIDVLKKEGVSDVKIEIPPDKKMGDYALPCFQFSKHFKKDPMSVANYLNNKFKEVKLFSKIEVKGPYLNFFVEDSTLVKKTLSNILKLGKKYGTDEYGKGKKVYLEHTSINPNASPHVGRARNAILGDSIARLLKFIGYKVETHYFVNDVGKQIALLVYGAKGKKLKFKDLLKQYVAINKKMSEDITVEKEVFALLHKYENGNANVRKKFHDIVKTCIDGQVEIFNSMGIKYDKFDYESKYLFNNDVSKVLKRLKKTGKMFEDGDGRYVLNQEGHNLAMKAPVLVLTRADKTSLYPLRDIAYHVDKFKDKYHLNVIVLGEDQKLYAQQMKIAMSILKEGYPRVVHYSFILLEEGKMSTRKGTLVLLEDFMFEALSKAKKEIKKRHGDVDSSTASSIAYGAIKFSILRVSAEKNVIFNWAQALNFEGESGPYVQYSYARICSIFKKFGKKVSNDADFSKINHDSEVKLVKVLGKFPSIVSDASKNLKVHSIAGYMVEVAKNFNEFYNQCKVLESSTESERLVLCKCVQTVLFNGMSILGITAVEKM